MAVHRSETKARRRSLMPMRILIREHTPWAKARIIAGPVRPKAKALGYLEATATAKTYPWAKVRVIAGPVRPKETHG
jgi:hypothetical protein